VSATGHASSEIGLIAAQLEKRGHAAQGWTFSSRRRHGLEAPAVARAIAQLGGIGSSSMQLLPTDA